MDYALLLPKHPFTHYSEKLINLRNCALILTLADTGLRVSEVCNMAHGDIDWMEGRAIVIGKGNKQAIVHFSNRDLRAYND